MIESNMISFKSGIDRNVLKLILDILQLNPIQRPTIDKILSNFHFLKLLKKYDLEHLNHTTQNNLSEK